MARGWSETLGICKMRCRFALAIILSVALTSTSAFATVLINGDNGGKMEDYTARFRQVRDSGESVVIDGTCMSACTMVLGLVPRDRICATHNAVLGFHAAWEYNKSGGRIASASGTRELMKTYPAPVRAWIARQGGLSPNMMFLRGRDLAAIVPSCDNASRSTSVSRVQRAGVRPLRGDTRQASFGAR